MARGEEIICLRCNNRWISRKPGHSTNQCGSCWSSAIMPRREWDKFIAEIREIADSKEIKGFQKIYGFLAEKGVSKRSPSAQSITMNRLLNDLSEHG